MHISFVPQLFDPQTHEPLVLEEAQPVGDCVESGWLVSPSHRYPIVRGVPRFAGYKAEGDYARSFGYQWNRWSRVQFESENSGKPMAGHTRSMWERIVAKNSHLPGQLIVDFGCGPGRFIEVARSKRCRVIGLDLSFAVEAAADNFRSDPDVLICQADVLQPPVRDGVADGVFSIGVLHHTPDPQRGFREMTRVVKPGGWIALAVYGKGGYYDFPTVAAYRRLFGLLWPMFKHYPPLIYSYATVYLLGPIARVPLFGKAVRGIFPFLPLADKRWAVLDTFDSVTPAHQSAHESYEVFQWFKNAGLIDIEPSDWGFSSYHGRKPGVATSS